MSYEEDFDRLMREKAEEMQYPFDEAHWRQASELIRKSRGGRFRAMAWGGAAVTGLGLTAFLLTSSPAPVEHDGLAATMPVAQLVNRQEPARDNQATQMVPVEYTPSSAGTDANRTPATGSQPSSSQPMASAGNEISSEQTGPEAQNTAGTVGSEAPDSPQSSISGESTGASVPVPFPPALTAAGSVPGEATAPEAVTASYSTADESSVEYLQGRSLFLSATSPDPDFKSAPVVEVVTKDDDYYKSDKKPSSFYVDAMAGAAYNMGWEKNGGTDGKGLNWYAGVNAGYFVSRSVSIGTGLQMFNIANITTPFHVVKGTDYDFSSATSKTVITCQQLQYFAVPLRITWHTKNSHELSFGLLGAQLWRADNKVESTVTRDNSVIDSDQSANHDLYEGMTQQLLMLNAGINFKIQRRFYVNAELVYGLTDLYNGTSYYASGREVPVTVRLGLTYRILQK